MKNLRITLLAICVITSVYAQKDKRLKGLEKELNKILKLTKTPGFSVAIVEGKKIIYAKGFGYRDYENNKLADANTLYPIASTTKAFTSSILGQLRQDGLLYFDESPLRILPDYKFYNDEMNKNITIADLMSHRTGLPRHDYSWYLFPSDSKETLLRRVQYQAPLSKVREKWYYNNFMFLMQGVIAERITRKSWEENIKERLFKPLGMTRSNSTINKLKKDTNFAWGYESSKDHKFNKIKYFPIAGMSPAFGINSSVNELSNWLITWINKGKFKGKQILPEKYIHEAISSQMVESSALPDEELTDLHFNNYGYGWSLSSYKGHYLVSHDGNIDGFSANIAFFPSDSIGIVVLTNKHLSHVPELVRNMVADRMLKTQKTDWIKKFKEKTEKKEKRGNQSNTIASKIENTKPLHPLKDYTGNYSNPGYGKFNISNKNDSLFASFKLRKFYLKHKHYDVFIPFIRYETGIDTSAIGTARFNFSTNNDGEIATVKINLDKQLTYPIVFTRAPNSIEVAKGILEKYVGNYEENGYTFKIKLNSKNKLTILITNWPEYELVATDNHKFHFKNHADYKIEFVIADDKPVTKLIYREASGTSYVATRK